MRPRLLDFLLCPDCHGESFQVTASKRDGERVLEGVIACRSCQHGGPILDGIPRLVPGKLQAEVLRRFPGFRESVPPPFASQAPAQGERGIARTLKNYTEDNEAGWFQTPPEERVTYEQASDYMRFPTPLADYRGKVGLDAGCGFGKDVFRVARDGGAEVVGADLSGRIDTAGQALASLPNVHLIQADLYTLPLRPKRFDFVLSLGMLHHLPDPRLGFFRLIPLVAPGGWIQIWVYKRGPASMPIVAFEFVRRLTGAWPYALHQAMGVLAGTAQWMTCSLPIRALEGMGQTSLAKRFPFYEHARYPWRPHMMMWVDNFHVPLWTCHTKDEIEEWLRASGLTRWETPLYEGEWMGHARGWASA